MKYQAEYDGTVLELELNADIGTFTVEQNTEKFQFTRDNGRTYLRRGTNLHKIDNVKIEGAEVEFSMDGSWYKVTVKDEQQLLLDKLGFKSAAAANQGTLKSPMPGKILDILVTVGDTVILGQPVAILEAMKMENELKSPVAGVIKNIAAEVGQSVEKKTLIMEIEQLDKFIIKGGTPLKGTLNISGSKNAALPIIAGALLADSTVTIHNVPRLQDIYTFNNVLRVVGAKVDFEELQNKLVIDPTQVSYLEAPYDLVRKMRASFYMLGALVGKHGYAKVSLPGGCAWGPRPVDLHLKGMEAMGIKITLDKGYVIAKARNTVKGKSFTLSPSSVGATVNLILAAVLRAEEFTIQNAAKEPDVVLLCNSLVAMGANIEGIGTSTLTIRKVDTLNGIEIHNDPDRIELGTYMIAGAMHPDSEITLTGCNAAQLGNFPEQLRQTGTGVTINGTEIHIKAPEVIQPVSVETDIYPGFPTDLQAQWATMLSQAMGNSIVTDTVYFDRFSYVPELVRLGAQMSTKQNSVHISGKTPLTGATVMSTDLRASVSLVLAAMIAKNTTEVLRVYHLDRGYEKLEDKLNPLGAKITRIEDL